MAREFFQLEVVTEHVDGMHFETKMQACETKLTTIDDVHEDSHDAERPVNPEVVATFWCIEKVVMVLLIAGVYIIGLRGIYCSGDIFVEDPSASDNGSGR